MNPYLRRAAEREAFEQVPETCPHVDEALEKAANAIKAQTTLLREAYVAAIERALQAESRADEAEEAADYLAKRCDELERELRMMEARA